MNILLAKNFLAEAAILANRIVKFGAADGGVLQAAAVGDKLIGVTDNIGPASGERCDIIVAGIADIKAGGAITRGDLITTDATGQAVTAAPGAGTNNRVIGIAQKSGVSGDVIEVLLQPGSVQG